MKVKIERQLYGSLLENDIKTAIDSTRLKDFTIHNLVLKIGHSWRQYDHLIITPHRIVPIEAKSTSFASYRVTESLDYFGSHGQEKSYATSIVQQVLKARNSLVEILNPQLSHYKSVIAPVGCIRASEVINEQTILPIHTDKTLWYFIKVLEEELALFPNALQLGVLKSVNQLLDPYRNSNDKYLLHLKGQGVDIRKTMSIEEELLVPTKLLLLEDENMLLTNKNKTSERLLNLANLLGKSMDTIPLDAYNYALKYYNVPIELLCHYIITVEDMSKEYPFLKVILNKNSHLIRGRYILYECRESNIFFSEFLLGVLKTYQAKYPDSYLTLVAGHRDTEVFPIDLESVLYNIKRGSL